MSKFFRKNIKSIFLVVGSILTLILVCCVVVLVGNFRKGLSKQATDAANHFSRALSDELDGAIAYYVEDAERIANSLPSTETEVVEYLASYQTGNGVKRNFRFFDNGIEYSENGVAYEDGESPRIQELDKVERTTVSGIVNDANFSVTSFPAFAVAVPAPVNAPLDTLLVFYNADYLREAMQKVVAKNENLPGIMAICSYDGYIFATLRDDGFDFASMSLNVYEELTRLTNDKTKINMIQAELGEEKTYYLNINGDGYAVTLSPTEKAGSSLYLFTMYDVRDVYADGHTLANTIGAIIITVVLVIFTLAAYTMYLRIRIANRMDEFETIDSDHRCRNFVGFTRSAEEILNRNKATKFAVIYTEIVHYSYIQENFGKETAEQAVKYLIQVADNLMADEETFGYVNDDRLVLLLHYPDEEKLRQRLHEFNTLANNCPVLKAQNYLLTMDFGVYCVNREKDADRKVQEMYDRASLASRTSLSSQDKRMRFYNDEIHAAVMHEAEIETKMEAALENGEFKIFYQPKYRINGNRIDGCEALVRWYDAENNRFRQPSEFLPLFETNGFIAKLDRYVFTEVCKFVNDMRSRNYRLVPISVNVSRRTAMEEGFTEFYAQTKRQYSITDKFIMIEFTESFAYENYEVVRDIVNTFHRNGFRCSIDDFGTGFSSYNVLKNLSMDEIKLDRFFIKPGVSKERDDKLLASVISLSRSLGLMVTQEGVETVEDLKRLRDMGCDVVQGYIYSKPLPATDFLDFVQSGGSIRIV